MVSIVTGFNNNMIRSFQSFGATQVVFQKYEPRFGPGGPRPEGEMRRKDLTLEDAAASEGVGPRGAGDLAAALPLGQHGLPPPPPGQRGPVAAGLGRDGALRAGAEPVRGRGPLPHRPRRRPCGRRHGDRRRDPREALPPGGPDRQAHPARPRLVHGRRRVREEGQDVRRVAGQLRGHPHHDVRPTLSLDQGRRLGRRRPAHRRDPGPPGAAACPHGQGPAGAARAPARPLRPAGRLRGRDARQDDRELPGHHQRHHATRWCSSPSSRSRSAASG